jgi:hypothetical protein
MKTSTLSGIAIAISSCLAPVAILFMVTFGIESYFMVYHYGIRVLDSDFFILVGMIAFEILAFVFGLISAIQAFKGKTYNISLLGAAFVLAAGILFFTHYFFQIFNPFVMGFSAYLWWRLIETFCGFPMVILSSIGLFFIVRMKKEFNLATKRND